MELYLVYSLACCTMRRLYQARSMMLGETIVFESCDVPANSVFLSFTMQSNEVVSVDAPVMIVIQRGVGQGLRHRNPHTLQ